MLAMSRSLCRSILAVVMAFAIVFPPVSDAFARALGGSGHHAHFDHVWHQPSIADTDHDDGLDGHHANGANSHSFLEHVHLAVMALPDAQGLTIQAPHRVYIPAPLLVRIGRVLTPAGHPPQLRA